MTEEVGLDELEGLLATASVPPAEYIAAAPPQRASAADGALHSERSREEKHRRKSKRHRHSDMEKEDEKSRKRSRYVLDTAESGSDEEDDEESEVGAESMASHEPRKAFIFHEGEEAMNDEELGRHFEERDKFLRAQQKNPVTRSGVEKSSYRYAAHLLPQEHDPKVFAIKCRPRMARVLVARIVNKCYAYRNGKNYNECKVDLGIISAFCLDHVKEYLYVEAYRKVFVENALNGLEGLFRYNITVVDPSELMQMLEKRRSNMDRIRVGSFVRLRQRNYRLDIAQVTAVHHDGIHITCKVVPREDFVGKPYAKTTTRLPAKFFIPSVAIDAVDRGDHYQWGDLKFDKEGYLLMQVSARMVISGSHMENPTTEELARFHHDRTRVLEAIEKLTDRGGNLKIGDTVRVISGQLRDAVGTIANIFTNTNTALLHCPVPGKAEPVRLQVELRACAKHFQEGVHVIIEKGEFAGESGTVVKSLGDVVVIFPDRASSNTQFRVQASDCHQSQLKGAFCQAKRGWELFDLVLVGDTNRVGCLVRLSNNDVDVITERNELKTLTYPEIKSVVRGPRQTADRLQNALTRGVEVNIQAHTLTPFNLGGQTARVVHVFNRTLFVCCRSIPENSGVVALSADCVLLAGGRTTTRHVAPPKQLPAPLRRPHNATKADISGSLRQQSEDWQQNSECFEMSSTDHNGH